MTIPGGPQRPLGRTKATDRLDFHGGSHLWRDDNFIAERVIFIRKQLSRGAADHPRSTILFERRQIHCRRRSFGREGLGISEPLLADRERTHTRCVMLCSISAFPLLRAEWGFMPKIVVTSPVYRRLTFHTPDTIQSRNGRDQQTEDCWLNLPSLE